MTLSEIKQLTRSNIEDLFEIKLSALGLDNIDQKDVDAINVHCLNRSKVRFYDSFTEVYMDVSEAYVTLYKNGLDEEDPADVLAVFWESIEDYQHYPVS